RTGDRVDVDVDGYLWFRARADDVIISAGYRIGPVEVESALSSHPAVVEAAAVAAPDDERGSIVRAVVVLRDGFAPSDDLAPALRELGLAPERLTDVAITHADVDHYGGDAEIRALAPGARLRAHALDRPLIERWEAIARDRYGWYRGHGLDYDRATWDWLAEAAGPDTPLDGELAAGERIDLGGLALEVLHLPGHSLGHVGLRSEERRVGKEWK